MYAFVDIPSRDTSPQVAGTLPNAQVTDWCASDTLTWGREQQHTRRQHASAIDGSSVRHNTR